MDKPCPRNSKNIWQSYVDQIDRHTDRDNKEVEKRKYRLDNKIGDIF